MLKKFLENDVTLRSICTWSCQSENISSTVDERLRSIEQRVVVEWIKLSRKIFSQNENPLFDAKRKITLLIGSDSIIDYI